MKFYFKVYICIYLSIIFFEISFGVHIPHWLWLKVASSQIFFPFGSNLPKNVPNHYLEHLLISWIMLRIVIWHIFWTKVNYYFLRLSHLYYWLSNHQSDALNFFNKTKMQHLIVHSIAFLLYYITKKLIILQQVRNELSLILTLDTNSRLKWACVCLGPFFLSFDLKFRINFYILKTWCVLWIKILDFIASYSEDNLDHKLNAYP